MKLEDYIDVRLPIIQSPMAGVQDSALALEVARAGGLGSLACASLSLSKIESELESIKRATNLPINLNFFCHKVPKVNMNVEHHWRKILKPYFIELGIDPDSILPRVAVESFSHNVVDILETYSPPIISFHFGLPSRCLLDKVKSWGATILASATTAKEALWLQQNGADLIIAQGVEAGGHRGMFLSQNLKSQSNTETLLFNIIEKVNLPVIAAGGIGSAKDVNTHLNNGAIAAQIGTAYLLCDEAKTSTLHKEAIKNHGSVETILTNVFSGRPARAIINRVIKELGPLNTSAPDFPLAIMAMSSLRRIAETHKSVDFSPLWCGTNTDGCDAISAYDLTLRMAAHIKNVYTGDIPESQKQMI